MWLFNMFKICMKELVKKYNTRNVVLFCILVLFTVILMLSGNNVFKILASLSFVAAGVLNYFYENQENKKFSRLLLLGLICGLFGDIGILIDFQIGAVCFGVGHILYILSFCKLNPLSWKDILPIMVFLMIAIALSFFVLPPETEMLMRVVCLVYAGVISVMTGKAVSLHLSLKNRLSLILCIGSIAFYISDIMILFAEFSPTKAELYTNICHSIYFPAQFILAQALSKKSIE